MNEAMRWYLLGPCHQNEYQYHSSPLTMPAAREWERDSAQLCLRVRLPSRGHPLGNSEFIFSRGHGRTFRSSGKYNILGVSHGQRNPHCLQSSRCQASIVRRAMQEFFPGVYVFYEIGIDVHNIHDHLVNWKIINMGYYMIPKWYIPPLSQL